MPHKSKSLAHSDPIPQNGIPLHPKKIEWKEYKLGEVAEIVGGGTPSTTNKDYWDGDIPWLSPRDLTGYNRVYIEKGARNITREGLKNSSTRLLPTGTVLFSSRAPIGYVAIAQNEICTNQGFKSLVCNPDKLWNVFAYYWLRANTEYLQSLGTGTTFVEISGSVMKSIAVSLPPLSEQKRIASILSSLDDKIDLLHRQNATLEAMAETLFRHHFIENPNPEWKEGKLGDVCSYVGEKVDSENILPGTYVSTENMLPNKEGLSAPIPVPQKMKVTTYKKDDVLLSNIRPYFKKIWLSCREGGCSSDVLCVRAKSQEFSFFVYYSLRQDEFFDYVMLGSKGCKMPRGDKQHIMNWSVSLPRSKDLLEFNSVACANINKIRVNMLLVENLNEMRNNLLQKLILNKEL